jgi:hypothetical protein
VAWCWGYANVLSNSLRHQGFDADILTMYAAGHERGRGSEGRETHEVVTVRSDGKDLVLDPTTNRLFEASIADLVADPVRADGAIPMDARWRERRYELYATSYWYSRIYRWDRRGVRHQVRH